MALGVILRASHMLSIALKLELSPQSSFRVSLFIGGGCGMGSWGISGPAQGQLCSGTIPGSMLRDSSWWYWRTQAQD